MNPKHENPIIVLATSMAILFLVLIIAIGLTGCGGGSAAPATQSTPPIITAPQPVPPAAPPTVAPSPPPSFTPPPVISTPINLVLYVGDDLTWQSCQPAYTLPFNTFQSDVANGTCAGVQGEVSQQTAARLPELLNQHPKVVVILTGLNDVLAYKSDTSALVDMTIAAQAAGSIVVLGTLPPSKGYDTAIKAWNAQVKTIAATYNAQLADYYAGIVNPASVPDVVEFHPELLKQPLMDILAGVYPNATGYVVMWGVVCVALDGDDVGAS